MTRIIFLLFFLWTLFISCNFFNGGKTENKEVVARAYDYYLYGEDLVGVAPAGASKSDSISIVKNFIENWVSQKVLLHKAEKNLDNEKKDVAKKLEEYRNSLIVYAYEAELIRQKLDTTVSEEQIQEFYDSHPQNFELKNNIIKVIYLKLNKKSPKLDKVKQWYKSTNKKDMDALKEYCHQYALNYYLDEDAWLLFDDLLKEIPIKTYDKEQFLQNNRFVEIEDSTQIYLVNIRGFMIKNSRSPLSFERRNIVSMILNERKLSLLEEMEKNIYQEARKSGDIEIY